MENEKTRKISTEEIEQDIIITREEAKQFEEELNFCIIYKYI
jgi:hypothetical protein